jgi:hypothetical protein
VETVGSAETPDNSGIMKEEFSILWFICGRLLALVDPRASKGASEIFCGPLLLEIGNTWITGINIFEYSQKHLGKENLLL